MEFKKIEEYMLFILVVVVFICHTSAGSSHGSGSQFVGGEPYDIIYGSSYDSSSPYSSYPRAPTLNTDLTQSRFSGQNPGGTSYAKALPVSQDFYISDRFTIDDKGSDVRPSAPTLDSLYSTYIPNNEQPGLEYPDFGYTSPYYPNKKKNRPASPVSQDFYISDRFTIDNKGSDVRPSAPTLDSLYSTYIPNNEQPGLEYPDFGYTSPYYPNKIKNRPASPVSQDFYISDRFTIDDKGSDVRPSAPTLDSLYSTYIPNNKQPGLEYSDFGYTSPYYPNQNKFDPYAEYTLCDPYLIHNGYSNRDNRQYIQNARILEHPTTYHFPPRVEKMRGGVQDKINIGYDRQWGEDIPLDAYTRYQRFKVGVQDRFGFWDSQTKMFINDFNQDSI